MTGRPRLKILHVTSSRGFYGAERFIQGLVMGTDPARFEVAVADFVDARDPHRELLDATEESGRAAFPIPCTKRVDGDALRHLESVVRREDIDILHCHEQKSDAYGWLAAHRTGRRIIGTNHCWNRATLLQTAYELLDGVMFRGFDHVVAVAPHLKPMMRRFGVPERRISVIPNGVALDRFRRVADVSGLRQTLGIGPDCLVIGNVGRLIATKGHRPLLESARLVFRDFPRARLLLVGDGPMKEELRARAEQLGIGGQVVFAGFRTDMAELYSIMDLFVSSSISEASPMVILEAMATGLPVVAVSVGGIPDVIEDRRNGFLLPDADPEALSRRISQLLASPETRLEVGGRAEQTVREEYTVERTIRRYENIYDAVMERALNGRDQTRRRSAGWSLPGHKGV